MSRVQETRNNMNSILVHDLNACPDIEDTRKYMGSLNDAWLMRFSNGDRELFFRLWFLENFSTREMYNKAMTLMREIDNIERDLIKLEYLNSGLRQKLNSKVQSMRKCRALSALWPTWKSVIDEATTVVPQVAQRNLYRLCIRDDRWLER